MEGEALLEVSAPSGRLSPELVGASSGSQPGVEGDDSDARVPTHS